MMIYVNIEECKDSTGKVIAVEPKVGIQVFVEEGYDLFALRRLEKKLQSVLEVELQECIS